MPFKKNPLTGTVPFSRPAKLVLFFLLWLVLISWLHFRLNRHQADRQVIRMGYMPVLTNLAAPLLDHATRKGNGVFFEAVKFSSFAEMAEALRNDSLQAAFIIAPLAVVLRQQGVDVKVVLVGNRHESTLVARKSLNAKRLEDLVGRTIAVPMRYSGHNLCLLKAMEEKGLTGKIRLVEMNPPDMASALASGSLDAYFVGEPFAAQTVLSDDADVVAYVESMWPDFICNLMLVKNEWMTAYPSAARKLVETAVRSGLWASRHPHEAARVAADYWNQSAGLVHYAMTTPSNRIIYDRYVPKPAELQAIADLMARYDLIENTDISGLVDDRLALTAGIDGIENLDTLLLP
ncbi:hypothetical protein DSCA_64260 [Desulfosarcina alkanivorans]|jgi:NitT/TauT family transport system substrate-binding protein|uniref:NLPA lipoprotein n=1 Tax=Desulfosarcina alkanivorans TaxID=571177 RepID=A0A5K7YT36_9BACT|nr:ABC transporter substrate-binding protein [Desulfosarcina alkanivorans]BBO72496.1 hypothetical protein DSCA_64260 [Desulfosarcina alkanivorans]